MAAAYYKNGALVEHAVSGIRKVGHSEEISKDNKFHLGSCTKSMTATIAARLVEDGLLSWDDTLEKLLPNYSLHEDFKLITFKDLLAHRSGLIKDPSDAINRRLSQLPITQGRDELARIFLKQKPDFQPLSYHYSNIGYITAGHILELITRKSWEQLMQEKLFDPLQMHSCGFGATSNDSQLNPLQPWGHTIYEWSLIPVHDDNPDYYAPSANVHCSLPDWSKYLHMHMDGFNKKSNFLKQASFDQLHKLYPATDADYTFGGWSRVSRSWAQGDVLTHSGTNTLNYATVWIAPEIETILISTTNRGGYSGWPATDDAIGFMLRQL